MLRACSSAPVTISVAHWIWHGLRAGNMALPTAANPRIETGGLCGESKSAILDSVRGASRELVAPYATLVAAGADMQEAERIALRLSWSLVSSPISAATAPGVRLVGGRARLQQTLAAYPRGVRVLQVYAPGPGEARVFYIRHPDAAHGPITSLTLTSPPVVIGDGRSTIRALLMAHPRAGRTPSLFLPHFGDRLGEIPARDIVVALVFTGNHCKGSVFRDGAHLITAALTRRIDAFARDTPDFHFGASTCAAGPRRGCARGRLTVFEVNGVGSEATDVWEPACSLRDACAARFAHYRAAWEIGRAMRARGGWPASLRELYRAWTRQRSLIASYPITTKI